MKQESFTNSKHDLKLTFNQFKGSEQEEEKVKTEDQLDAVIKARAVAKALPNDDSNAISEVVADDKPDDVAQDDAVDDVEAQSEPDADALA